MTSPAVQSATVFCVAQRGRLEYEAVLFTRSFRATNPDFTGRLIVCEPTGPLWPETVAIRPEIRSLLLDSGAEIVPFENRHFGAPYPQGNKIEALSVLPPGPFLFFDTDTLFTGPLAGLEIDFHRPSASMRREGTWPQPPLYGPGYAEIWKRLYDLFDLDFPSSLDLAHAEDHWERYLYFNAGWFYGADAQRFGARFREYALRIRDETPDELACQSLFPWLDQIALPLVIHGFGGGRPGPGLAGLDGSISCHYRTVPLLYARESDAVVAMVERIVKDPALRRTLRDHIPLRDLVLRGRGRKIRKMFDRSALPRQEAAIRNALRGAGLWLR